jgi:hypothetical protein
MVTSLKFNYILSYFSLVNREEYEEIKTLTDLIDKDMKCNVFPDGIIRIVHVLLLLHKLRNNINHFFSVFSSSSLDSPFLLSQSTDIGFIIGFTITSEPMLFSCRFTINIFIQHHLLERELVKLI